MNQTTNELRALLHDELQAMVTSARQMWHTLFAERYAGGDDVPDEDYFIALWITERFDLLPTVGHEQAQGGMADGLPAWLELHSLLPFLQAVEARRKEAAAREDHREWFLSHNHVRELAYHYVRDYGPQLLQILQPVDARPSADARQETQG